MLALVTDKVIIRDRDDDETCWVAHSGCAERVVSAVNEQVGYARLYVYGPADDDGTCADVNCAAPKREG